ncbi:MAG: hypothetical protein RL033_554, partial [Pseudomonadota bacterium]
ASALALASSCDDDDRLRSGQEGGSGGNGASGGSGGSGGSAGNLGGQSGATNFCQGTRSIGTRVLGQGFPYPDGVAVTALFVAKPAETALDRLEGGAFQFAFYHADDSCPLGDQRSIPAALYIDVDGDGVCTLATDEVFVWEPSGGILGTDRQVVFSPSEPHCPPLSAYSAPEIIAAVRQLCPEIGDCLPFCNPPNPRQSPGDNMGICAGIEDAGAMDSGVSDRTDAAVLDASVIDASVVDAAL